MKTTEAVAALAALAQETRLDVFRLLVRAGAEGLPAGEVATSLGVPAATLSFHLKEMTNAGLIAAERDGRSRIYRADFGAMNELLGFLTKNCCQGVARAREAAGMTEMRLEPLETAATWLGQELQESTDWVYDLSQNEVTDLERGLSHARATGKPLADLKPADFPLPLLEPALRRWLEVLQHGRGFLNVRGVPVDRHDDEDVAFLHWGLGLHLGTAVSQNAAGDLLGHVRDTGADPQDTSVRLYKTRVDLGFHSDGSDLVGLLCIRQGRSGGANRLVSTTALYNEILRRRPDLLALLYEPFHWDRNDEQADGEPPTFELPICRYADGHLTFFYIPWYIRKAQRHADVPRLTHDQQALLDLIDEIAADPAFHVEMRLEPGEINYLKNNAVLHARTEFDDFDEPERKRHLVRLWLTAHGDWADGDAFVQQGIPKKAGVVSDADDLARTNQEGA